MDYVVDFTGYYVPEKKFIIKEFCLIPIVKKKVTQHKAAVVNPPYAWRKLPSRYQNEYLNRFYKKYGIEYSQGNCSVNDAFNTIINDLKKSRTIYLKNASRKRFLLEFTQMPFSNIVCLDSAGYDLYPKMSPGLCSNHASRKNYCVIQNAFTMAEWLLEKLLAHKSGQELKSMKPDVDYRDPEAMEELANAGGSNDPRSGSIDFQYSEGHRKLVKQLEDLRKDSDYASSIDADSDLSFDTNTDFDDDVDDTGADDQLEMANDLGSGLDRIIGLRNRNNSRNSDNLSWNSDLDTFESDRTRVSDYSQPIDHHDLDDALSDISDSCELAEFEVEPEISIFDDDDMEPEAIKIKRQNRESMRVDNRDFDDDSDDGNLRSAKMRNLYSEPEVSDYDFESDERNSDDYFDDMSEATVEDYQPASKRLRAQ
ncbi:uncharacterized protein LOC130677038 [Microplitis mediator]|uniref:uncharacterized protein LOC130677038 n=1 Tax=Microplitis mediator TaxID=375433 RepID=UPI00255330EB|nr:uncharacterized protein LOC130677038 [Microplitis mediator]